jgi:hypothetical protein
MKTICSTINRRAFLRLTAATAGGAAFWLAGCQPTEPEPSGGQITGNDYYASRKELMLKELDDNLPYFAGVLSKEYAATEVEAIQREGRQAFESLIPRLPYIGGDANMLTTNLLQSAWCLAFYQVLQPRGKTTEDVGRIIYRSVEAMMDAYPRGFARLGGVLQNSSLALGSLREEAEISQQRRYPDDWVFAMVEGDGTTFDWGVDYTECGICKFFQAQGAPEFTPYLCLLDFPMSQAMGAGLVRTETLANGNKHCNFRYKLGGPTQPLLPPGFLDEPS